MTARTFIDPTGTNRVGLVADVPSLDALQAALARQYYEVYREMVADTAQDASDR
jgi:hypothetical protein